MLKAVCKSRSDACLGNLISGVWRVILILALKFSLLKPSTLKRQCYMNPFSVSHKAIANTSHSLGNAIKRHFIRDIYRLPMNLYVTLLYLQYLPTICTRVELRSEFECMEHNITLSFIIRTVTIGQQYTYSYSMQFLVLQGRTNKNNRYNSRIFSQRHCHVSLLWFSE
jgi:hypothetical protein